MVFTKMLTPDQHRDLRKLAATGVKLKRLAATFGLGNPSTAFKYKYTIPDGGDWPPNQNQSTKEGDISNDSNSLDMQGAPSHIPSHNDPVNTSDPIQP